MPGLLSTRIAMRRRAFDSPVVGRSIRTSGAPQLAGISVRELGAVVDTIPKERAKIIAAIDLLITGV